MSSRSIEVATPQAVQGSGYLTRSYLVYPISITTNNQDRVVFSRRYTDFENLRSKLCSIYWYCVIPPLPEKENVIQNLGITKNVEEYHATLGSFRRKQFEFFLQSIFEHPVLSSDILLQRFTDDARWKDALLEDVKQPTFLDFSVTSMAQTFITKTAFHSEETVLEASISVQRQHLDRFLESLKGSLDNSQKAADSLSAFSESIKLLRQENEFSLLPSSAELVFSPLVRKDEEGELLQVVTFWRNMCDSALETVRHISAGYQHLSRLGAKLDSLQSARKANADISTVNKTRDLIREKEEFTLTLNTASETSRSEISQYFTRMSSELTTALSRHHSTQVANVEAMLQAA